MRQRLHVGVVELVDDIRHGGDAGAHAGSGFEIVQRLEQNILALAGKPRRRAEARIIVGVTRRAAVLPGELFAGLSECVGRSLAASAAASEA